MTYDVVVCGAGPAGATCAYYLGLQGKKVALLEKKTFPRDKLCGDAVATRAQSHLRAMGVLDEIVGEKQGNWARVGGLVTPTGKKYIGDSTKASHNSEPLIIAIKRIVMDEKIARAAQKAGAELIENTQVVHLERTGGEWTVQCDRAGERVSHRAKVVVIADGALSRLATALGIVKDGPDGICSRSYIQAGTHNVDADGVMIYTSRLMPGYAALFKEANGEVNYCCYIIPGGRCSLEDLHEMHHSLLEAHPYVKEQVGPRAVMEKMRGAPLRLGGIPKSFADGLLIVGDAAGHIDPLTGEGIHHAMDGAHQAAITIGEAFAEGELGERMMKRYHDRWMKLFGRDFFWSKMMVKFYAKYPIFLDAYVNLAHKKGSEFLADWGKVMTGAEPKTYMLRPQLALPIAVETGRLWWERTFRRGQPSA